ncbi:hypothetical protein BK658_22215 [Pseudomonas brassicacearum]|uniref:Uncharacterized protein n=1 Tax=Pseudomonas brassicacearum TaxID=930166 RepID=A0A423GLJ2_9PSED|nr:hypothetical protein BK658_22215 [Pseudomonas brassicacearum]
MLNQFGVFYITQTFARDDNDIPTNQRILVEAKRFAHQTLEAIAFNGELHTLFPDNQPETGVIEIVGACKEQEIFPRNLAGRGVKDCLEMPGGKQTLFPTEVLTHLQYRIIKLPDAHDLWRDDATGRHGRSW